MIVVYNQTPQPNSLSLLQRPSNDIFILSQIHWQNNLNAVTTLVHVACILLLLLVSTDASQHGNSRLHAKARMYCASRFAIRGASAAVSTAAIVQARPLRMCAVATSIDKPTSAKAINLDCSLHPYPGYTPDPIKYFMYFEIWSQIIHTKSSEFRVNQHRRARWRPNTKKCFFHRGQDLSGAPTKDAAKINAAFTTIQSDMKRCGIPQLPRRRNINRCLTFPNPQVICHPADSIKYVHGTNFNFMNAAGDSQPFPNAPAFFSDDSRGGYMYAEEVTRTTLSVFNPFALFSSLTGGGGLDMKWLMSRSKELHPDAVLDFNRYNIHTYRIRNDIYLLSFEHMADMFLWTWDVVQEFRERGVHVDQIVDSESWEGLLPMRRQVEEATKNFGEGWSFGYDMMALRVLMDTLEVGKKNAEALEGYVVSIGDGSKASFLTIANGIDGVDIKIHLSPEFILFDPPSVLEPETREERVRIAAFQTEYPKTVDLSKCK